MKETNSLAIDPIARILYAGTVSGVWQRHPTPVIDARFRDYCVVHDGWRVLGSPISDARLVQAWPSQYFEKGRIENHRFEVSDPNWRFVFGLLTDALRNARSPRPVGGDGSTLTYVGTDYLQGS